MDNRKRQDAGPSGLEIYSLEDLLSEPQETPDAASSRADASKSSGTGDSADSDHVADSAHDIQDAEHTTLDEDIIGAVRKARTSGISRDEFTVTTDTSPVPVIVGTSLVEEEDKAGRTGSLSKRKTRPAEQAGTTLRSPAPERAGLRQALTSGNRTQMGCMRITRTRASREEEGSVRASTCTFCWLLSSSL